MVCGGAAPKVTSEEYAVSGNKLVDRFGKLLHEGHAARLIAKDEAVKNLLEIPAIVDVVGAVWLHGWRR